MYASSRIYANLASLQTLIGFMAFASTSQARPSSLINIKTKMFLHFRPYITHHTDRSSPRLRRDEGVSACYSKRMLVANAEEAGEYYG